MNKQLTQENNNLTNIETIETYLCSDEEDRLSIVLSPKQQELLERWNFADDLLRKDRFKHQEIVNQLTKKFGIRESSAWDDLRNAQIVFGSANALNKRYTSYAQIRRLETSIRLCLDAQRFKEAADFEKVLQKAVQALPDAQTPKSPRKIIFNIQNNNNTFSASDDELKAAIAIAEEYTDYIEEPEEEEEI